MYHVSEYNKLNPNWVHGIDVSKYQDDEFFVEDLNLAYQAGYRFCLIRATRGGVVDIKLEHNFDLAASAGFIIGFYHYYSNRSSLNGEEQGQFHIDTIYPFNVCCTSGFNQTSIDVERYYNNVGHQYKVGNTNDLFHWLERLTENSPWGNGVYSSKTMWALMTSEPMWANNINGWIADWTEEMDVRYYPRHWSPKLCKYWQWAVAGHPKLNFDPPYVPGIKGQCDVDIYRGTLEELEKEAGYDKPMPEPSSYEAKVMIRIDGKLYEGVAGLKEAERAVAG